MVNDAAGAVGQRGGQRQPGDRTALNFVFDQLIRQNRDPDVLLDGVDDRAGARAFPQRRDLNLGRCLLYTSQSRDLMMEEISDRLAAALKVY